MNIIYWIILIISWVILIAMILSNKSLKANIKNMSTMITPITPESRKSDLTLVYDSIDRAIVKTLYEFSSKDHHFSNDCPVKACIYGHYRDLISYLLRPDIVLDSTINDDGKVSFFETFVINVYYRYISETSESIKNLFFKYNSGYTMETYMNKSKIPPSVQPFIIEYTRNYLWCRYEENVNNEHELLQEAGNNSDNYVQLIQKYDRDCLRKLSLNIYHINDMDVKVPEENNKEVTK